MAKISTFRDLLVWQKSMKLVTKIYQISTVFPQVEMYALTSQMRRSAISIPSNIAEGYGRGSSGDYKRFLKIARGSLFELETQIEIAFNLSYVSVAIFQEMLEDIRELDRMLSSLINKILT